MRCVAVQGLVADIGSDPVEHFGAPRRSYAARTRRTKSATARPISSGLSSWTKWRPLTVTSVWLGQVRQTSRWRPTRMEPGSALTKSFGTLDVVSHFAGQTRVAPGFLVVEYPIPRRCAAMYYPESNVLAPIGSTEPLSNIPTYKSIVISLHPAEPLSGYPVGRR